MIEEPDLYLFIEDADATWFTPCALYLIDEGAFLFDEDVVLLYAIVITLIYLPFRFEPLLALLTSPVHAWSSSLADFCWPLWSSNKKPGLVDQVAEGCFSGVYTPATHVAADAEVNTLRKEHSQLLFVLNSAVP